MSLRVLPGSLGAKERPQRCPNCHGMWIPIETLETVSQPGALREEHAAPSSRPNADRRSGVCPNGHGPLKHSRLSWEQSFFVDRCVHCRGLWFDAGEWTRATEDDDLLAQVAKLWKQAPTKISQEERFTSDAPSSSRTADLQARIRPELFQRLTDVADELKNHPLRSEALAYLHEKSR